MKKFLYITVIFTIIFHLYSSFGHAKLKGYTVIKQKNISPFMGEGWVLGILNKGEDGNIYVLLMPEFSNQKYLILKFDSSLNFQDSFLIVKDLLIKHGVKRYSTPTDFCVDFKGSLHIPFNNHIISFDKHKEYLKKYNLEGYFIEKIICNKNSFFVLAGQEEHFVITPEDEEVKRETVHEIIKLVKDSIENRIRVLLPWKIPPVGHILMKGDNVYLISQGFHQEGSSFIGNAIAKPYSYYELFITSLITGKVRAIRLSSIIENEPVFVKDLTILNDFILVTLMPSKGNSYLDILSLRGERIGRYQLEGIDIYRMVPIGDGVVGIGTKTGNPENYYLFLLKNN